MKKLLSTTKRDQFICTFQKRKRIDIIDNFFSSTTMKYVFRVVCQKSHRSQKVVEEKILSTTPGFVCIQPNINTRCTFLVLEVRSDWLWTLLGTSLYGDPRGGQGTIPWVSGGPGVVRSVAFHIKL